MGCRHMKHSLCGDLRGGGGVEIGVDTKLKETERACVENYRKMSVNTLLNKVKP